MNKQLRQPALAAFLLVIVCGCQHIRIDEFEEEDYTESNIENKKTICFTTGFSIKLDPMRSLDLLEDYANTVNWYDYQNNILQSQNIIVENIGNLSIPLKYGVHHISFIAHSSVGSSFNDATNFFSTGKVTDTFWSNVELSVDENTDPDQNVSLKRIVGKIMVKVADAIPSKAKSLCMTVENHCASIDVKTGMGVMEECKSYSIKWTYKDSTIGKTNTTYSLFSYIPSEDYSVNIKIDVLGENDNLLYSKTIKDVPLKMNQNTTLTGEMFNEEKKFSFSFSPDWDGGTDISF